MADFFFFTDVDLLNSQTADQAYGPAGTVSGKDRFRVTSVHTATGTPKAYAVCDGVVCIQQDSENANVVNLILKPNQQPSINCSRIKYIIYKGINKESLLDGDNILVNIENDLTKSILSSWDAYILNSGEPTSIPSSKSLGYDLNGPVHFENEYSDLRNEKYNVTSVHHALDNSTLVAEAKLLNHNPKLYAPCDCTVFVTPINEIIRC